MSSGNFSLLPSVLNASGARVGTMVPLGGGGIPPAISNFAPAPGTPINAGDSLQFDVTAVGGLRLTALVVSYAAGGRELAFDDDGFTPAFAASTRAAITGGYRYTLRRTGGWPSAPTLKPYVIDIFGDEVP